MPILKWSHVACRVQGMAHVMSIQFCIMSIGSMSHLILRNGHVALSNLRVKDHFIAEAIREAIGPDGRLEAPEESRQEETA